MTEGEKIISVGQYEIQAEGLQGLLETFKGDGHIFVGSSTMVDGVLRIDELASKKTKPSVAIIHDFSNPANTDRAVRLVKKFFPGITVVTWGADHKVPGADYRFGISTTREDLQDFLLKLEH